MQLIAALVILIVTVMGACRLEIDTALGKGPAKKKHQQQLAKRLKLDLPSEQEDETDGEDSDADDEATLKPAAKGVRTLFGFVEAEDRTACMQAVCE